MCIVLLLMLSVIVVVSSGVYVVDVLLLSLVVVLTMLLVLLLHTSVDMVDGVVDFGIDCFCNCSAMLIIPFLHLTLLSAETHSMKHSFLQIPLLQQYPQLKQCVRPSVEKAVQDLLGIVVERSIKVAITTTEHIIKKVQRITSTSQFSCRSCLLLPLF